MKTVKTLIASVVIAVAAFSSVAQAAYKMDLGDGVLVVSSDEQSAVVRSNSGDFDHFYRVSGGVQNAIDNYGSEYTAERFSNGYVTFSLKIYEDSNETDLIAWANNNPQKIIVNRAYKTSEIISTNH